MIDFLLGVPGKLKTITDYLTTYMAAARMAKIDNCDTTTSSRAPANTALSSGVWTQAHADKIAAGGIPGTVKSIQTGYVSATASMGTGEDAMYYDVAITAVSSANKCVVLIQPAISDESSVEGSTAYLTAQTMSTGRLTSTTNLRLTTMAMYNSPIRGRWTVIEYY